MTPFAVVVTAFRLDVVAVLIPYVVIVFVPYVVIYEASVNVTATFSSTLNISIMSSLFVLHGVGTR